PDLAALEVRGVAATPGRLQLGLQVRAAGDRVRRDHRQALVRIDAVERLGAQLGEERSEEHTSELQSLRDLVCRLLLEKKNETGQRRVTPLRSLSRSTPPSPALPYLFPRHFPSVPPPLRR